MSATPSSHAANRTVEVPAAGEAQGMSWKCSILAAGGATAAFHLAYVVPPLSCLIVLYLYGLVGLSCLPTARRAFYFGLVTGWAVYAPHLTFFWAIFGWPAIALWTVLAFWLGLFVALSRLFHEKFGRLALVLVPFAWTGLEYFRSEIYYLRFSWLSAGYAFHAAPQVFAASHLGVYGVSFVLLSLVSCLSLVRTRTAVVLLGAYLVALAGLATLSARPNPTPLPAGQIHVAGVQMEFPAALEVPSALDKLLARHPETELLVLSEYTFDGPIPDRVRAWCRDHNKYLIAGGKDFISESEFCNTAFVVGPRGEVVFRQVKSVPIQFFKDGRPATGQKVWESPWGKLGICICYDLSYRRVTDELIRQGARAIIAPTMDVADWGENQHLLHARIGPVRAAEYGVPIFRVCSSGISQLTDRFGQVAASAPFPGENAEIVGTLELPGKGRMPFDRWLAPLSVAVTLMTIIYLLLKRFLERFSRL